MSSPKNPLKYYFLLKGMFSIQQETYSEVKTSLKEIFDEIGKMGNYINIDGVDYPIKFYFCSDWKMLALVTGIKAANCDSPCLWCMARKGHLHSKKPSQCRMRYKKYSDRFTWHKKFQNLKNRHIFPSSSQIHESILPPNIPLRNVIIDTLHMFLRISDSLITRIEKELAKLDNIGTNAFSAKTHPHLKKYLEFMNNKCKLNYSLIKQKGKAVPTGRCLRGLEKQIFFENVNILELLPESYKDRDKLNSTVNNFYKIMQRIRYGTVKPRELQKLTSEWINDYMSFTQA